MSKIEEFKQIHLRFNKALRYIVEHETELKANPARWEKIKQNFYTKFEQPL